MYILLVFEYSVLLLTEYIPLVYVDADYLYEAYFRFFGLRTFVLRSKETIIICVTLALCLDKLLTGYIDHYLLRQHVYDIVLVDIERTLFYGIKSTVLK